MPEFLSNLFDTSDFPARWHCGIWSDFHGWVHIVSDVAMFVAYSLFTVLIFYVLKRRRDVLFPKVVFLFAALVFACGTLHLIEAVIFWFPIYRVSALIKFVATIITWTAVLGFLRILPAAIAVRSARELENEVFKRNQAELQFRELLESAPDATVITSEDGSIVLINRETENLFGYNRHELVGRSIHWLVSKGKHLGRRKDGSKFPVEVSHGPIQTEEGLLISNAIRDVSERVARQKELEREQVKFEAIVRSIPDALMFSDTDRRITYCNPAVEQVFGYEPEELLGQSAAVLYEDRKDFDDQGRKRFRVDADEEKKPFEANWKRKDGTAFPGETIGSMVRDPSGVPVGFLGLIRDITERKETEESFRIQEQVLRSERKLADEVRSNLGQILEESLDEIYIVDVETLKFLQVNRGGRNNTGYDMNELLGMSPWEITISHSAESIQKIVGKLRNKEVGKLTLEDIQRRKDGTLYDAEMHLQLGTYLGKAAYVAFVRDVSERIQIQRALEKSEQRFAAFMDYSPFFAWVKDSEGRYEYVSRMRDGDYGILTDDWIGKKDVEVWPSDISKRQREVASDILMTGNSISFEANYTLPNGSERVFYVVKFPFNVGDDETLVGGISVDVTEQRRAESERDRFFEASADMMCIANFDKYFTRVNQAFTEILGYTRKELLSRPFTDLVHPDDVESTIRAVATLRDGGRVIQFENRFRHKNGSFRLISWTTPFSDDGATSMFAVGRDITEQRALERNLLQIADDEQRRIAHDLHDGLGQELAGASMMAKSLVNKLEELNLDESGLAKKLSDQLGASLHHSRSLARGLRPVEIDTEGLQSALLQLADRISEAYQVKCSFHCVTTVQPNDPESATHLYRIAQEAVTNAAIHGRPQTIEIHLNEDRGSLELKVVDDGRGMDIDTKSKDGIGMKSMRYRSNVIGARFEVQSSALEGTVVVCRLASN